MPGRRGAHIVASLTALDRWATVPCMDPTDARRQRHDEDTVAPPEPARRNRRRRSEAGLGDTIGGALVGFDYQVFRATRPPAILVESAKPVRGLSGEGGAMLSIDFPEDISAIEAEGANPPADRASARETGLR